MSAPSSLRVVATAGHVDHGKSTLVAAVTDMDPDRFAEEKARGLTIDLGFAWMSLPSGRQLAFVDVPGHIRFIKNMLAGTGAVDVCLFVVAATEGWKPQSEEHLRIVDLLGLAGGVVALTKAGLVDEETLRRRRGEIAEHTAGTVLARAPVIEVDSLKRVGLGELVRSLDELLDAAPGPPDVGRPRLWIDRSFAVQGAGTVVTGTLAGGSLRVGDELVVVPGSSAGAFGATVRVRGLQTHRRAVPSAQPGQRLAVNLAGIAHRDVHRGQALVRLEQWEPTAVVDASLQVLGTLSHPVSRRGDHRLHVGSAQLPVRLRVLGREAVQPGQVGLVRLHLAERLALVPGDRFVLRESGRSETVGGGEILDIAPVLPAARARPDRSLQRVVRERGWVDAALLYRLTGVSRTPDIGPWVVDAGAREEAEERLRQQLGAAGALGLDLALLDDRRRALAEAMGDVTVRGGRAWLGNGRPEATLAKHFLVEALEAEPFTPPDPRTLRVDRAELRELVRQGLVVECGDHWFAATALRRAAEVVAGLLARQPEGVTVSDVRVALGSSRRFVLPLLAHLDATGVTRRRGDVRIGGPRLPEPKLQDEPGLSQSSR